MGAAAIPAALTVGGGLLEYEAQGQAGKNSSAYYDYLARNAKTNAGLATASAKANVEELGTQEEMEMSRLGKNVRGAIGSQKAALVTGAGLGSKTAEQIINDTLQKGNLDEAAIRYNSAMKQKNAMLSGKAAAFNFESEAGSYSLAGRNALNASKINQLSSILGTGRSVASMWYKMPNYGY
jgi:hypothetical protein